MESLPITEGSSHKLEVLGYTLPLIGHSGNETIDSLDVLMRGHAASDG
jgi:hypothetical protein